MAEGETRMTFLALDRHQAQAVVEGASACVVGLVMDAVWRPLLRYTAC
jgi:hypothetical protein